MRYASKSKQLEAHAIDAYVRETVAALSDAFAATAHPFTQYHGCSKANEQIVEVCLPTDAGDHALPEQDLLFTSYGRWRLPSRCCRAQSMTALRSSSAIRSWPARK
jgi:hypothetical protein